jgi:hypothetical protein
LSKNLVGRLPAHAYQMACFDSLSGDFRIGLLDSLSEVQRIDPSFCARMECAADLISANLEEAWKLLDATSPRSA